MAQFGFEYLKRQFDNFADRISEIFAKRENVVTGVKGSKEDEYRNGNVDITSDNIGAVSKSTYDDEVVPHLACLSIGNPIETGWYRVAALQLYETTGYNQNSHIFSTIFIKRNWSNGTPENHEIKLLCANGGAHFIDMISYGNIFCKNIRVMWDKEKFRYYLEIYYDGNNNGNKTFVTIFNGMQDSFYWTKDNWPLITDTTGLVQLAECDISTSYKGLQNLNINGVGKNGYITYPEDGYYTTGNTYTGYMKITLPQLETNTLIKFRVSIMFSNGKLSDYIISGYLYKENNGWYSSCSAVCTGSPSVEYSNLTVRFGHNGEKAMISIGESETRWIALTVKVCDIMLGYQNVDFEKWSSGWNVEIATTPIPTVQQTIENTHVAYGHNHEKEIYLSSLGTSITPTTSSKYATQLPEEYKDGESGYTYTFNGLLFACFKFLITSNGSNTPTIFEAMCPSGETTTLITPDRIHFNVNFAKEVYGSFITITSAAGDSFTLNAVYGIPIKGGI